MLRNTLFVLKLRASGIRCSWITYFENTKRLSIGKGTWIDALTILKGGRIDGAFLKVGSSVRIRRNCYLSATHGKLSIGDDVLIAHNTWIAGHGETFVGQNTVIGPNVVLISSNHDLTSEIYPAMQAPEIPGKIEIGSNCWIGANVTVVPNVRIGDNCIIGGGSVVTKDVQNGSLVAGNPSRFIRSIARKMRQPYKVDEA